MRRGRRFSAVGRPWPYFILGDVISIPFFAVAFIFIRAAAFIFVDVIVHVAALGVLRQTRGRVWPITSSRLIQFVLKGRFL